MASRTVDGLAGPDHELGRIERDPEYLGGAEPDRLERALHAVIAHEDENGSIRLVHFADRGAEAAVGGRFVEDGEVAAGLPDVGDLHLDGGGAHMGPRG